jgi:hypothetical protein
LAEETLAARARLSIYQCFVVHSLPPTVDGLMLIATPPAQSIDCRRDLF